MWNWNVLKRCWKIRKTKSFNQTNVELKYMTDKIIKLYNVF